MGSKAFGEQNPTLGEDAVSWQTWSDGDGDTPNVTGDADWGKLSLQLSGAEGRSAVYDLGSAKTRTFTLTENRYGTGENDAVLQIRGDTTAFTQDDTVVDWETYAAPIDRGWRYVQVRETTFTYYFVDATLGDDDAAGTRAEPWQTITKVNAASLNPGDCVLFKRGETFAGNLSPTCTGTDAQWITFGAYGTGNRPIIDGSASIAFRVTNTNYHHMRFEHLDFSGVTDANVSTAICWTHDMYFYDCIFRDSSPTQWGHGFAAYTTTGADLYNITLDSCDAYDNHSCGYNIGSTDGTAGPHDVVIKNCTAHDNGTNAWADHGIYARHGVTIENCTAYDNPVGGGIKVNCQNYDNSPYKPVIRNNICYNNYIGLYIDNVDSIVYNNLCYSNTFDQMNISNDTEGSLIYFNTLVNTAAGGDGLICIEGAPQNITFRNNLFIQDAAVADLRIFRTEGNGVTIENFVAANDIDYNLYYHDGTGSGGIAIDTSERTWATWVGYGAEANGTILSNTPDFVARYTNLHPADGGDLKALGIAIVGYITDLDGNERADPPTQGCYEEAAA